MIGGVAPEVTAAMNCAECGSETIRTLVLTGGPGAGKTTVAARLAQRYPQSVVVVPEAATQIYRQLGVRWRELDAAARREFQRRVLELQLQQEELFRRANPRALLLLDRGTVDGAAYWPDGPESFFAHFGTTLHRELARYDAVIWLESTAAGRAYADQRTNPFRQEDAAAAVALAAALARLWQAHGRFERVGLYQTIDAKVAAVETVLRRWGACLGPPAAPADAPADQAPGR